MKTSGLPSTIAETLWGRRGIVKANHVWLALAVFASSAAPVGNRSEWLQCLLILAATACFSQASILANDLSDRDKDRAAEKKRWIFRLPPAHGIALVAAVIAIGMAAANAVGDHARPVAAYLLAVAFGLAYSVPPLGFKERNVLGLAAYSMASLFAYAVFPWVCFPSEWRLFAAVGPAVLLDKWVNLQFHQIIDIEADRQAGARTYTTDVGPVESRKLLRRISLLTAAWLAAALIFILWSQPSWRIMTGGVAALALAVIAWRVLSARRAGGPALSPLMRELPLPYLGLTFVLFRLLPFAILSRLALEDRTMWPVLGLFVALVLTESTQLYRYRYE